MDGSIPSSLPQTSIRELEAEITQLAGHINAASYRWLMLIAEFDNRKGWSDSATQSCAHWLNWKCGITLGAAREKVRVAHALAMLPKISASMEEGELSYYKVRELTRVATPETEDTLLMIAQHGSAHHVETVVRHFRRAKEVQELSREEEQQLSRAVSFQYDDDGSLMLKARLPAEAGAAVMKALNLAMEEVFEIEKNTTDDENVPHGTPSVKSTPRMRRADALSLLAESYLAHGAEAMSGGDKYQVVVHVAEETLANEDAGQCEFEDGASMAAETCRRLACDCSLVHIREDEDGDPLNVGRKTRSIPPALRRALNARDKGCRFPGCCNKSYTQGHHVKHWASGGETKLSNLVTLCHFHHHLVHEGGWSIQVLDDGAFRFLKPNGEALDACVPKQSGDRIELFKDDSARPAQWRGDKMDYHLAVQVLCQRETRSKQVTTALRV